MRRWFAPEDLKIGDKFRVSLDEAIRLRDGSLLGPSEHSLESLWVEKKVETVFETDAVGSDPLTPRREDVVNPRC